jgi:hypothetical protein
MSVQTRSTFDTQPEVRLHLLNITLNSSMLMSLHWGTSKIPERRGIIQEGECPKLDILLQSLKGLNGGHLFCYPEVINTLRYALVGVQCAAVFVGESGHLLLCCVGLHN